MKFSIRLSFGLLLALMMVSPAEAQFKFLKKKKPAPVAAKPAPPAKKNAIKSYDKVITKDAKTDEGLFKVHQIDENYFYEIPDSLFGREMLMVSRISKTADGAGFGGGKINTQVLRWEKKERNVLLRVVSYSNVAADSLPIHEAVVNSNFEPVMYSFKIETLKKDSIAPATVIKVNDLYTKDVNALGLSQGYRTRYKVSRLDAQRSYIEHIKSYPLNVENRHVKTYFARTPPSTGDLGSISIEINNSMILLPEEPMKRRYFDERVG